MFEGEQGTTMGDKLATIHERVGPGLYRHYKGATYMVLGVGTLDEHGHGDLSAPRQVIYVSTRAARDGLFRLRAESAFSEPIEWPDGVTRPRFTRLEDDEYVESPAVESCTGAPGIFDLCEQVAQVAQYAADAKVPALPPPEPMSKELFDWYARARALTGRPTAVPEHLRGASEAIDLTADVLAAIGTRGGRSIAVDNAGRFAGVPPGYRAVRADGSEVKVGDAVEGVPITVVPVEPAPEG